MSTAFSRIVLAGVFGAALFNASASAHHSFAMFDQEKKITLRGTVKEFQWTNPHVWIQLMVPDQNGRPVEWSIEGGSLNTLTRQGWRAKSLKPGDQITIDVNPLRNGNPGGSMLDVVLANGTTLWGGPTANRPKP